MLLQRHHSALLLIDLQKKLTPLIEEHEAVVQNCKWMLDIANDLQVPILVSEQYPKGLDHTVTVCQTAFTSTQCMDKLHFSCTADQTCLQRIQQLDREQWVLIGIETHVCVLQTALGLRELGKEVYVVADAVGSRYPKDKQLGLQRMRDEGVKIISREMALFEWLHQSGTDEFKRMSKTYLERK